MKKVLLSILLAVLVVFPSSVLADPPTVNIPPTNAYVQINTTNGSVTAPNFISSVKFVPLHGIQITANNASQSVFFSAGSITPVGDRFGWYASDASTSGGVKDQHFYNFSTGHGIAAFVGTDDFILSAIDFVNATSKLCPANQFIHSYDNNTGVFTCLGVNATTTLDTIQNLTPAQAYIYAKNNTNFNFQFRGINVTGSLSISNSTNLVTIHAPFFQNNTGLNIGHGGFGFYAGMSGSILQFKNLTSLRPNLFTVGHNGSDVTLDSIFKSNTFTCPGNSKVSAFDNSTGIYTCSGGSGERFTTFQNIGKGGAGVLTSTGTILQGKNITSTSNLITVNANITDVNLSTPILSTVNIWTKNQNFQKGITIPPGNYTMAPYDIIFYVNATTGTMTGFNGTTGVQVLSGIDIGALTNSAMNLCNPNAGCRIFYKYGNYTISTRIVMPISSVLLQGEQDGTAITRGTTAFYQANNANLTNIINNNGKENSEIRDLFVNGNKGYNINTICIVLSGDNSRMENDGVMNCPSYGIQISGEHAGLIKNVYSELNGNAGFLVQNTWSTEFIDSYTAQNQNFGYYIEDNARKNVFLGSVSQDDVGDCYVLQAVSAGHGAVADLNTFSSPLCITERFTQSQYGFRLLGAQHNIIEGAIIQDAGQSANNTYDGLLLQKQGSRCACYNTISNMQINSSATNKIRYGVNEADNAEGWNIYNNIVVEGAQTKSFRLQNSTSIAFNPIFGTSMKPSFMYINGSNYIKYPKVTSNGTIALLSDITSGAVTSLTGTAGNITASASTGPVTLNTGYNVVVTNGVNQTVSKGVNFTSGNTLRVLPSANRAGINIGSISGADPTTLSGGDMWFRSDLGAPKWRTTGGASISFAGQNTVNTFSSGNTFTGSNTFSTGTNKFVSGFDSFTTSVLGIENPAKTFDYSIAASAITANRTLNLPLTTQTETLAVQPQSNFTSGHNGGNSTGTVSSSYVMLGNYATITPTVTGNIRVIVSGYWDNSVATDGCTAKIMVGTANLGTNGGALSGTLVGLPIKMTSATLSANSTFSKVVASTGNAVGTKLFFDFGFARVTGGQCTMRNVEWLLQEY